MKFTRCLSCPSDAYSSSFLMLAIVRYYFPDAWHEVSLVRPWQKKYTYPETTHFWQPFRSTIRTSSQAKSKIRTQKIDETVNRCKFRIRRSVEISLWIRNPSKIIFRILRSVGLFTPLFIASLKSKENKQEVKCEANFIRVRSGN